MYKPCHLRFNKPLGLLISLTVFVSCLVLPNALPGRPTSQAMDRSSPQAAANFIDNTTYFVRQHYLDFLSREPDPSGLQFWSDQITSCGSDTQCAEVRRINVSAAFFLSIEFQETGYLVYRFYKAAFGNITGKPVPVTRRELSLGTAQVGQGVRVGIGDWQQQLEQNKIAFAAEFVADSRFTAKYPAGMSDTQFVDMLNANTDGALSASERTTLINAMVGGQMTRAQVLRAVAEDSSLKISEFRKAFVLLQYFGYLTRNPDAAPDTNFEGYSFWLSKLDQFNGDYIRAEMVKAFISSGEYRQRFAQPELSAFDNPGDPQLLRAVTAKGEVVDYFGEKDAAGQATSLRSIRVTNTENQVTNIGLDAQSRPIRIQAFNGTEFRIAWLSTTNIVITALSADGEIQVNIPIDLAAQGANSTTSTCCAQPQAAKSSLTAQAATTNKEPRAGNPITLTVTQLDPTPPSPWLTPEALSGTSLVTVNRCGKPVNDANVGMTIIPSADPSSAYTLPGALTGSGQYTVSIPNQPSPGQEAEDICGNIAGKLGNGCDALSALPPGAELQICAAIGAAIAALNPVAGGAVFTACEVGFIGARLYCDTLGWSPVLGAPSILEMLCGNISEIVDRFGAGQIRLIPIVFVPGKGLLNTGSGATAPGSGPFPSFNVDAGTEAKIVSFTTSPADPAPFQDYIAEALIQCAPSGTQVTLSIVGTDGFSKSVTTTIPGDANVTMTVPGGAEGVVDTITVAVSNGPTRKIVLVF